MAQETRSNSIAPRSQSTYQGYVDAYARVMATEFQIDAFPLTEEKISGFLMFQRTTGKCDATLLCYITAFSWYFRTHDLDNLVHSVSFKQFKSGLKRAMLSAKYPHQKAAFVYDFFPRILQTLDMQSKDDRRMFLLMTLAYHFFMRVSEIVGLKVGDLTLDNENRLLECNFTRTKTDQFGQGTKCYIVVNDSLVNPAQYLDVLEGDDPDAPVSPWKERALLSRLRSVLTQIGENPTHYSWNSFRRGGAYRASEKGVQDCVIKKHGRWNSEAYQRYVAVDAVRAGREITMVLTD